MANPPPERIGRYQVLATLGRGSMGCVYAALDPNIDRKVAIKVVSSARELDDAEREEIFKRFVLEARAAGRLHHPGIVMVFDADRDPGSGEPYLAMEWVDGRTLHDLLREAGKLPIGTAVSIAAKVALALDFAHQRGIVHRDVKPANILVGADGAVKLSDFGIAKFAAENHTTAGQVLGTPSFMSPEQISNTPLDGRSDLFSLAVVLYRAVSGQLPFTGDSIATISYKIAHVDPRPIRSFAPEVSESLARVIERGLEKDPGKRFQSGALLAEALEAADLTPASGPSAGAAPEPPSSEPVPTVIRTPTVPMPTPAALAETTPLPAEPPIESPALFRTPRRLAGVLLALLAGTIAVFLLRRSSSSHPPMPPPAPTATAVPPPPASGSGTASGVVPASAASAGAAAEPARSASPSAAARPAAKEKADSALMAVLRNPPEAGTVTISIDGHVAEKRELAGKRGFFGGTDLVTIVVRLATGIHKVEVTLDDPSSKLHTSETLSGGFEAEKSHRLDATFDGKRKSLALAWTEK